MGTPPESDFEAMGLIMAGGTHPVMAGERMVIPPMGTNQFWLIPIFGTYRCEDGAHALLSQAMIQDENQASVVVGFSDILDRAWAWLQIHVAAEHKKVTMAQILKITRPSVSHLSMGLS